MDFSPFFKFLSIIKTIHWLTTSYSVHVALDDAHSKFSDKIDEFVENYMGYIHKDKTVFNGVVNPGSFEAGAADQSHPYIYFREAYNIFRSEINQYIVSDALKSIADDMDIIANRTCYLLRLENATDWGSIDSKIN